MKLFLFLRFFYLYNKMEQMTVSSLKKSSERERDHT